MRILIYDEFSPEDTAMMQALYSRSASSAQEHAEKVKKSGSGSFMERYYVGYGHKSIADCGSTTLFIEHVSMLAAKAIQQWPLYSGQETSTRYIDMLAQPLVDPLGTKKSAEIQKDWMKFYDESRAPLMEYLKEQHPLKEGENDGVWERAIQARAFDILRAFLPAGLTTQLSWHTNLRQAHDKVVRLRNHPLDEVREIGEEILGGLAKKYPHSFSHKIYETEETYQDLVEDFISYHNVARFPKDRITIASTLDETLLTAYALLIKSRPEKTNLPYELSEIGSLTSEFLLDFGSYRDLQRHRNGVCRMPLLTTKHGFQEWYLKALSSDLRKKAKDLMIKQEKAISTLKASEVEKQYYIAMGYNVFVRMTYALPAFIYVLELRSSCHVHPTLRFAVRDLAELFQEMYPKIPLYIDQNDDQWSIIRGHQTIQEK